MLLLLCLIPGCGLRPGQPANPERVESIAQPADIHSSGALPKPSPAAQGAGNIAHISDIHFDPFYDPSLLAKLINTEAAEWEGVFNTSKIKGYGSVGSDANYNLLHSFLADMAGRTDAGHTLDFIVFTGDFLRHDFNQTFKSLAPPKANLDAFIKKDFQFMLHLFNKYFPDTPVYISLGNNDSYSGDYRIQQGGKFLQDTAAGFADKLLKLNGKAMDSFNETYRLGGYYAVNQPWSDLVIISLNSIFFSNSKSRPSDDDDPALEELNWLGGQLEKARQKNQKVWLLTHIPPGDNTYNTLSENKYDGQWQDNYTARLIALMGAYAPVITAGFAGHTHVDDYRILADGKATTGGLGFFRIGPSVSPIFNNNPAYQLMSYDRQSSTLRDYDVFYLNLAASAPMSAGWAKEYNFKEAYGQQTITAASLLNVYSGLKQAGAMQDDYSLYYNTSYTLNPAVTKTNLQDYLCTIIFWTPTEFNHCLATVP